MKQPNLLRKAIGLLFAPLALAGLPTYATTLTLDPYPYQGYYNQFSGVDVDGNSFRFNITDGVCKFIGVTTEQSSIEIPESVILDVYQEGNPQTYTVTHFFVDYNYYWGDEIYSPSFEGCENLKEIILPNTIESIVYKGYNCPASIHFTSSEAPVEVDMENLDGPTSLARFCAFVPEEVIDSYKAVLNPGEVLVVAEGSDPIAALEEPGSKALRITPNSESGINYSSWAGTDAEGNLYAFEDIYNNFDITFRGAITGNSSITMPDSISAILPEYFYVDKRPVTRFCLDYYNDNETGFPGCTNLKDVYVSPNVTYAEWHGEGFSKIPNFHFSSETVPSFNFYDGSESRINIYVPDELFTAYADALDGYNSIVWSESPATPVYVNVATPGTLADEIASIVENLESIRWIVVTGTPNELDLRILRRLPRLEILDLSQTTGLESVSGCNGLKYLREVTLPEGITSIGNSAFKDCRSLYSINIPEGINAIDSEAFSNCYSLNDINLPASVKRIGRSAFNSSGLQNINLVNVTSIEGYAFQSTRIQYADLSNLTYLGDYVFSSNRNLTSVKFGDELTNIESGVFEGCNLTGTITLPKELRSIGWYSFSGNSNLTRIEFGKEIFNIDNAAFRGCRPEVVISNILFPINNNGFTEADLSNCTLYVPALTLNEYLLNDNWVNFTAIEPLEEDITELDIDREYALTSDKGIADKATLNLTGANGYGHMTVNRKSDLNLGNYNHFARLDGEYYDPNYGWRYDAYYNGSTIIPESVVTAENVVLNMSLRKERWYFLSFPFDVNVKDIVVDEDALWVVRKYSGEDRAALTENTWQNMTDETVLKAGEGYIFHCAVENREEVNFTFRPAENGNALFAKEVVAKELASYPSEFAHNASWNLVGNTFPAYMTIKGLGFEAPVTVWQDNTYFAYSPVDDEYVFDPFQAFFVQRQEIEGGDVISLNPQGRAHSREAAAQIVITDENGVARAPRINNDRVLFNIFVNGENGKDRTRLVINEEASAAYESNRDASKFMSSEMNVPQIFVMNNNNRMAIDELPLGEGEFTLGTRFGVSGEYSISLDTRNAEGWSALLTDNMTGVTTDLFASAYAFTADAATDNNRFTLRLARGIETGIDEAIAEGVKVTAEGNTLNVRAAEEVEITVAAADGKVIAAAKAATFSTELPNGIYVVKAGDVTTKINVSK